MEQPYSATPNSSYGSVPPTPPKNWLVESILVTIFCCLPFGIVGIIKAAEVNTKVAAGDYAGAQQSSQEAGKWTKIGFFCALAGGVIYGVLLALGIGTAVMQNIGNH
ncbi:MAG: CD225/dispanin family protein [Hymenobacter sp.]|jgi:hypothetical protein|nr:CD225/dispanin family protein [Hymenobacter sp.]